MKNCWEHKECGREPGGDKVLEMGVCAAAVEARCNDVNGGHNGGRVCWLVAGTLCGGEVQGLFANKVSSCLECDFYTKVREEEGIAFDDGAGILPQISDPAEIAHAFDQLRRTHLQLKSTQAQFIHAQKLEAVGKVAAGVAHEINNPLTGIMTMAEELVDALPEDTQSHKDAKLILHEALRCRQIVRDLLDFSRQREAHRQLTSIQPIVNKAIDLVKKQYSFHGISFILDFNAKKRLIKVDPTQIQQVILNLIINARDSMDGCGDIAINTKDISEDDRLIVEVTDRGCGIDDASIDRIFDPFFSTKGDQGNGLGLAAVQSIIEEHGASITVTSKVGLGTSFCLSFPYNVKSRAC